MNKSQILSDIEKILKNQLEEYKRVFDKESLKFHAEHAEDDGVTPRELLEIYIFGEDDKVDEYFIDNDFEKEDADDLVDELELRDKQHELVDELCEHFDLFY